MSSSLDFLTRPAPGPSPAPRSARPPRTWLLPAAIFGGFAVFFAALWRDRLLPAPSVQVAVVLASEPTAAATAPNVSAEKVAPATTGPPLFQASGWVEPDPYPVKVATLVDGVVSEVLVLEGETVEKGQLLARLVDDDARLALAAAEARHQLLVAERETHLAALEAADRRLEAAEAATEAAGTLKAEAEQQWKRLGRLSKAGAVSELDEINARLRLQREGALHRSSKATNAEASAEQLRLQRETQTKDNAIALAQVAVDQARLALERTTLRAPVAGRVLRLAAAPGDKKMLAMDDPDSSAICVLYDPQKLQARVDVPLADAARLRTGQRVKLHSSLLPDKPFDGEVTRIGGVADLQRNTLQVKVRIFHPSDQLRPEMLCRAEFFGEPATAETSPATNPRMNAGASLAVWMPTAALHGDFAWVCDPESKRLSKRAVTPTGESREAFTRVSAGVRPGEQVVLTTGNWRDGQRVNPTLSEP